MTTNLTPERIGQIKGRVNQWASLWRRVYDGEDVNQSNYVLVDLLALLDAAQKTEPPSEVRYDEEGHSNENSEKPHPKSEPAGGEDALALDALDEAVRDAYAYRQGITTQKGYTDACAKEDFEADEKSLAHVRSRLAQSAPQAEPPDSGIEEKEMEVFKIKIGLLDANK